MILPHFMVRCSTIQPVRTSSIDTDQRSGKIKSLRTHGKLVFFDLVHGDVEVQIMLNIGFLVKQGTHSQTELANLVSVMQTGDYYCMYRSKLNGQDEKLRLSSIHWMAMSV
jgi:hypothetical protein